MSEPSKFDFAEYDESFKSAEPPPPGTGDYPPIEDGRYLVRVERCEAKFTKKTGKPMISTGMKIADGERAGAWLWHNMVMSADPVRMGYIKRDLSFILGAHVEALSEAADQLLDAIGREFRVDVVTKGEYQNVYFVTELDAETPGEVMPTVPPTDDDIPF